MRIVIQRVSKAKVVCEEKVAGAIESGLLILLGITHDDNDEDLNYLAEKAANLRIFEDSEGKMNLSLLDTHKQCLVVSQFTLYAETRMGRRPSFIQAARPEVAEPIYESYCSLMRKLGLRVEQGVFGGDMKVDFINDGPVTIVIDSSDRKK